MCINLLHHGMLGIDAVVLAEVTQWTIPAVTRSFYDYSVNDTVMLECVGSAQLCCPLESEWFSSFTISFPDSSLVLLVTSYRWLTFLLQKCMLLEKLNLFTYSYSAFSDKNLPCTLRSGWLALGSGSRSFEVTFIYKESGDFSNGRVYGLPLAMTGDRHEWRYEAHHVTLALVKP